MIIVNTEIALGILIPFLGTSLGSACVFLLKNNIDDNVQRALTGFAAGVMVAASVWSLIIPAIEMNQFKGMAAIVPVIIGFWVGILFIYGIDKLVPHLHQFSTESEGLHTNFQKTTMLLLAVTIHNIPEGMSVGAVYAGCMLGNTGISVAGAFALAVGIAIQNFPEGAIISMPLKSEGMSKPKAFLGGVISGAVEPLGAIITIMLANIIVPIMPYFLSFAAGAMIYVVVEELIPEMSHGSHSNIGTIFFAIGFSVMMSLDVVLG